MKNHRCTRKDLEEMRKTFFFTNKPNLSILVGINGLGSTFFDYQKIFCKQCCIKKKWKIIDGKINTSKDLVEIKKNTFFHKQAEIELGSRQFLVQIFNFSWN